MTTCQYSITKFKTVYNDFSVLHVKQLVKYFLLTLCGDLNDKELLNSLRLREERS